MQFQLSKINYDDPDTLFIYLLSKSHYGDKSEARNLKFG